VTGRRYTLTLTREDVVVLLLKLATGSDDVAGGDASLLATCGRVRAQLNEQGAFEDMAAWYGDLEAQRDEMRRTG